MKLKVCLLASFLITVACTQAVQDAPSIAPADYEGGFSYEQLASLAQEVLKHTPDQTHFAKGTTFEWVLLPPPRQGDAWPRFEELVRQELRKKYIVYGAESEIPRAFVWHDGVAASYRNGFIFSVTLRKLGADRVEIEYRDYEGSLAGGRETVEYSWSEGRWEQTAVRDNWVS